MNRLLFTILFLLISFNGFSQLDDEDFFTNKFMDIGVLEKAEFVDFKNQDVDNNSLDAYVQKKNI